MGREHYAHGTGGTIRARLVPMKPDGTPDLSRVLAEDTFPAPQALPARSSPSSASTAARDSSTRSSEARRCPQALPPSFVYQNVGFRPARELRVDQLAGHERPGRGSQRTQHARPRCPRGHRRARPARGRGLVAQPRRQLGLGTAGRRWTDRGRLHHVRRRRSAASLVLLAGTRQRRDALGTSPSTPTHESGQLHTFKLRSAPQATTLTEAGGYGPEGK